MPTRRTALKTKKAWRHIKQRYGLTPEEYMLMYARQEGRCPISGLPLMIKRRGDGTTENLAVVDHCHTTGKIRGIISHNILVDNESEVS